MAGYTRQSTADIVSNAVIKAAPVNAEYNAIRDAFTHATGHKHDGSSTEGAYVPLIADVDAFNKVVVDTANDRISFYVQVGAGTVEQLRIQDGAFVPVTDSDIDLGASGSEFKDLYIDGIGYIDTIAVHENATIAGTLGVTGLATLASVDINAGSIDGTAIGAAAASTVIGTTITAANFVGPIAGAVTGNVTGNVSGDVTGDVTGDLTGNVTAGSGTSSFNNVTINGSLDMNSGTSSTITGLSTPSTGTDATTKTYVDSADALKLNLTGGTLSGELAMGGSKVTGLATPTATGDAATKGYVDQEVTAVIAAAPGALDTLNELAAAIGDDENFSTTITNSIATKLPLAGGTMSGAVAMSTNKVTGLGDPTLAQDASTKSYTDAGDALKVTKAGDTMSGALAMGTNKVTGLGTPTAGTDATTKTYVDAGDALQVTKSGDTMSGVLAMGANKITGVADPTLAQDVVTKNYSDTLFGSTTAAATSASNAATSETNAANSATASANSATASANSASTASTKASEAATSATEAANAVSGSVLESELASVVDVKAINQSLVSGSSPTFDVANITLDDTNLIVNDTTNLQTYLEGVDHSILKDRGTGVASSYVSSVVVGGTTFAQPVVHGEINSDQGFFHIDYAGATGITVADLSSASTYVYIDNANALQQQITEPTRQDWSRKLFTMRIAVDLSTNLIIGFEYLNNPSGNYSNSMRDIYSYLIAQGVPFKKDQLITGRAGDLGFDVSAGTLMEFGGTGDINNANIKSFNAVSNATFFLATRTAFDAGTNTALPKNWDNAGTLTALGSTTVVGHRLYRFSNGNLVMQYGQGNYANMDLAKTGAVLEDYVLNPILKNATFFGWWFIQSTATNTGGTTLTSFVEYTLGITGGSSSGLSGALLKGNNLSDLLDATTARTNLGAEAAGTAVAMAIALGG